MAYLLKNFSTFVILTIIIVLLSNDLIKISLAQTSNCDSCDKVNKLLEPCNDTLIIPTSNETGTIVNVRYFVNNSQEAKCWCSEEFYDLLLSCTACSSTPNINATVEPLDEYKNSCKEFGTEFKESSSTSHNGPNGFLLALGISALVTLLASLAFCICFIRNRKKKSLAYKELKDFNYSSKGRGIEIGGRNIVSENDGKELYTPSTTMPPPPPPPAVHQPQTNEQQQQSNDQNKQNLYRIHTEMYGQQQYYVNASQSQVDNYEYSDNTDNVNVVNNGLSPQYVYQHYPA